MLIIFFKCRIFFSSSDKGIFLGLPDLLSNSTIYPYSKSILFNLRLNIFPRLVPVCNAFEYRNFIAACFFPTSWGTVHSFPFPSSFSQFFVTFC